jgi:hypothetical protein
LTNYGALGLLLQSGTAGSYEQAKLPFRQHCKKQETLYMLGSLYLSDVKVKKRALVFWIEY